MTTTNKKQLCMINVVFETTDDDLAIGLKRKVSEVCSNVNNVRIDFRLSEIDLPLKQPNAPD